MDVDDIMFLVREVWRGRSARQLFMEWQEQQAHALEASQQAQVARCYSLLPGDPMLGV